MTLAEQLHPAINAALNLTCFVFLVLGRVAIARGDVALHRKRMLTAFAASSVFLVSYLIRFATTGAHKYPGAGLDKTHLPRRSLFSHMVLAVVLVPLRDRRAATRAARQLRRRTSGSCGSRGRSGCTSR